MKGYYIKSLLLCLLQLALLSCIKETPGSPAFESVNTIPYSVTVTQSPLTRVAMSGSEFADGCYLFESGDKLYVEYKDGETLKLYGVLNLISGAGTGTGRFDGELKCLNDFVPEDNTLLKATLVGANAADGFFGFGNPTTNPDVDPNTLVTGVTYPSSVSYTSLSELVRKYSYFTGTSTFEAKRFNNLTQQSVFLQFKLANFRKNGLADPSSATANILIKKGSLTLHTVTGVPIGDSAYYGNANCSTVVQAGDALAGAQIQIDDNLEDSHDPLVFKRGFGDNLNLETNHYYSVSRVLDCFRIKATENETTVIFRLSDSIEYSEDQGGSWHTYSAGKQFSLNAGDEVWFRGARTTCDCNGNTQLFTANRVCYIAGDITALLADPFTLPANAFRSAFSRATFSTGTTSPAAVTWVDIDPDDPLILPTFTSEYCYAEMFRKCTSLTRAPELPAAELAAQCYFRMFSGCSSLTTPPATLPATTLNAQCYYQMFDSCTSLGYTPSFPGEKGTINGTQNYYQMFNDCTALSVTSGKLFTKDTQLTEECFHGMFRHCSALVTVPEDFLPSMLMAKWCYRGLFEGAAFTDAPLLPATTLVNECYRFLYNSCKNLTTIKCNATNPNGGSFTTKWTEGGLPSSGTFYKNSGTKDNTGTNSTKWPRNGNGIPSGWTVENL